MANLQDIFNACCVNTNLQNKISQIAEDLNDSKEFITDVVNGVHRNAIVFGTPGMGKTHLVISGLEKSGLNNGEDYLIARSHITPRMFYAMLYLMRQRGQFVILDDCDGVMNNEEGLNLLKAATDPTFRQVGWNSSTNVKLPTGEVIPDEFEFNGSVIICTNMNHKLKGRNALHFNALRSRSVCWNIEYQDKQDLFALVFHHIIIEDYLSANQETTLTLSQKVDLVKFIMANLSVCPTLDLRKPQHIAKVIKAKPNNWQNQARRILKEIL